jgi:2-octaprenyl-6-methoxyphenol hydroxylase
MAQTDLSPQSAAPPGEDASHDVLIIGGGLVGASLAIALDRLGLDVGLVEATAPGTLPAVFDERNLSFAEATLHALSALGVMQKLRAPIGAIQRIHVSRSGDFGRTVLDAAKYGRSEFGRVVIARDFGEALEARLTELTHLRRYRPARFLGLVDAGAEARGVRVADASGERVVRARLLVAADGTRSGVRDALGIAVDEHDYAQTLFVARLRSERAPDGTAYERFGAHGPTALLPRGDRCFGLVHGVARDEADAVAALDDAGFLARVQDAFGWRIGRFLGCGPRSAYPVTRVLARALTAPRAVLVGNAAQTIHPIGAQGFNLGLRDALTLAELIEEGRRDAARSGTRLDCGDAALLARYTQRRGEDRERTVAFSDGLARFTANESTLLRPLRSLGLVAADRLPSAQAFLVGAAMGYRGDVPALCRGEPRPGVA